MQLPYRGSSGPLHLLVDSTGIKVRGEGEWHARKHGGARRRVWRKVHLAVDESTLEVRAIEITGSGVGDAPVLLDLLDQIPEGEPIASITADGAYDTRGCRDAIANRGADALIPPRRNATSRGQRTAPGQQAVMKPCARSNGWAARSGAAGAAITAAAAPRYEPGQKTIRWIVSPAIG